MCAFEAGVRKRSVKRYMVSGPPLQPFYGQSLAARRQGHELKPTGDMNAISMVTGEVSRDRLG